MNTILITGIGGDIAQNIASVIAKSRPEIRLIGTDISTRNAGHLYVEKLFKVPIASSKNYLENVRTIIQEHSVDIIIPSTEQELAVFHPLINELGAHKFITAGVKVIDIGIDKLKTIEFIASLGIPVPWTVSSDKYTPQSYPCIFKAKKGSGSKNIFVVENLNEARFFAKKFPESIFQELLEPDNKEITCAVYRAKNGKVAVLQLLRELTGGYTSWAKVVYDQEVFEICKLIATGFNLRGSINIQLRMTNYGPRVFEINPRFSSTVLMRHRLGFCDLLWAIDESQDVNIVFPDIAVNQCIVRAQDAIMLSGPI
jgi:carbamoyl-phosphate synthase large subunit